MGNDFSRNLEDNDAVRHFLKNVLKFDYTDYDDIIEKIVNAERGLIDLDLSKQTLYSTKFRNESFRTESDRWKLREQIITEIISKVRLSNDEDIALLNGGALPNSSLKSNRQAVIIIGLPASGKSSIAASIADEYGAIILDSDFVKRKLPEFNKHLYGATIVHEESSQITFGFEKQIGIKSVWEVCLELGHNIVIPKIGESAKSVLNLANILKNVNNYEVHLISIELLKRNATIRAIKRYYRTDRYVPLGLIFDGYGNDPSLTYYYLRSKYSEYFNSFGALSTDIQINEKPFCTDNMGNSPALSYEKKQLILQ